SMIDSSETLLPPTALFRLAPLSTRIVQLTTSLRPRLVYSCGHWTLRVPTRNVSSLHCNPPSHSRF
ncbi:hypothetical protein PFISCL1PPCAC_14850, partial [Pristionchus fissidentatus]